jgi:fructokinase
MGMTNQRRIAGVELGGTKAIATLWQDGRIIADHRVPTQGPDATFDALLPIMQQWWQEARFDAVGIASFGPITLNSAADDYGSIRTTPKPEWSGAPILPRLAALFDCPIGLDTDVNAAALAEYRWGAGQGAGSLLYLTIGTGVGGGALVNGVPIHGRLHPEMGHMLLRRQPGDGFAGVCPFHGDCVEGLLSGPALKARFGVAAEDVPATDARWDAPIADCAQLLAVLIHSFAPDRILVGGGVGMGAGDMLRRARLALPALLGGYYPDLDQASIDAMIRQPQLGDQAGPLGAIALGLAAIGA